MSEQTKKIERTATYAKTTPGTFQFLEDVGEGQPKTFRTMYLEKHVFSPQPKRIRVTVEVLE